MACLFSLCTNRFPYARVRASTTLSRFPAFSLFMIYMTLIPLCIFLKIVTSFGLLCQSSYASLMTHVSSY
ncbi:hypothetical protein NY2A_b475L [Paramecium bursaria Chlorella virus NY2A]|uniref:Uncharacterized protein b475L n=1 Tax=Paramecium bursaria Chlorella virus NY2A TaxID=46021 RepID=A7IX00_PBCVN|nr:hypothetical protein NY2A_b475L [Paramecium bursaria Chlorella virus NY2A]ABT14874.1 hypothetical protein NY2A_b475L [Paramecium bursaria Chlorella virus NY2A]